MKRMFFLAYFTAIMTAITTAQTYQVYSYTGNIKVNGYSISTKQLLSKKSILNIPEGGKIVLFDEKRQLLATIKGKGRGTITELLKKKQNTEKKISGSYLTFIIERMTKGTPKGNTYMQSAGSTFRQDNLANDSLGVSSSDACGAP